MNAQKNAVKPSHQEASRRFLLAREWPGDDSLPGVFLIYSGRDGISRPAIFCTMRTTWQL
jgi:hypothetical protein